MRLLILLFILSTAHVQAQESITKYYTYDWKEVKNTKRNKSAIEFYSKAIQKDDGEWQVTDYYFNNDAIRMKGTYLSINLEVKEGSFTTYDSDGIKTSEGNYLNNKKRGKWIKYHQNGIIKSTVNYKENNKEGVFTAYNSEGIKTSEGMYSYDKKEGQWLDYHDNGNIRSKTNYIAGYSEGEFSDYFNNGKLRAIGTYKKNKLTGILKSYYETSELLREDSYENGELLSGNCYTKAGVDTTYFKYKVYPSFPGGQYNLIKFLQKNIKYPGYARENNIQGKVYIEFLVNKNGEISKPSVIKSVHPLLDNESLRVISNFPNWIPGTIDGEKASVLCVQPVNFGLR